MIEITIAELKIWVEKDFENRIFMKGK